GPLHPHRRRAARLQLPAVAARLHRALLHRHALARFQRAGARGSLRVVPAAGAALRPHQRAAARRRAGLAGRLRAGSAPADRMLRTRVITAAVILLVLVGMIFFAPPAAWSLFVLAIALAGLWEWSRLCGLPPATQSVYLLLCGALGGAAWVLHLRAPASAFHEAGLAVLAVAAAFWIFVAPLWLRFRWRPAP